MEGFREWNLNEGLYAAGPGESSRGVSHSCLDFALPIETLGIDGFLRESY